LAATPEAFVAFPSSTALAPTMSSTNEAAGDCIFGSRLRLSDSAKFAAVTGFPSENLKPGLTLKTYVLPSFETAGIPAAASGPSRLPCTPSLSGKPSR
jgi:hypothetical protein